MKTIDKIVFLHIPKTGGAAMQYFFYDQLKIYRNYFLSFFGHDDSAYYKDELITNGTNHCLIESLWYNSRLVEKLSNSPHFQAAKLLFGHTTYSIKDMFPEYNFQFITILREPIERTVSNIVQLTIKNKNNTLRFGNYIIDDELCSCGYWDKIYKILSDGFPVNGLMRHENLYLQNCITRIIQGDRYLPEQMELKIEIAKNNLSNMCVANFASFNESLQKCFNALDIPISMSKNKPTTNRKIYGQYYGAPDKILDLVSDYNTIDLELFNYSIPAQ